MSKYQISEDAKIIGYEYSTFEIVKGEMTREKVIISKEKIDDTFDGRYRNLYMKFYGFDCNDINYQKIIEIVNELIDDHLIVIYKQIETKVNMFLSYLRTNWELDPESFCEDLRVYLMNYRQKVLEITSEAIEKLFGKGKVNDDDLIEIILKTAFVILVDRTASVFNGEYIIYKDMGDNTVESHIMSEVLFYETLKTEITPEGKRTKTNNAFVKNYLFT